MEASQGILGTLVHISDLHFGEKFSTDENTFKKLLASLPYLKNTCAHSYQAAGALSIRINQILEDRKDNNIPAGVVFTGDLTRSGEDGEFIVGTTFLRGAHHTGTRQSVGLRLGNDMSEVDFNSTPSLFYVPGNHDIWKRNHPDQLATYLSHFPSGFPKIWKLITGSFPIFLYGLDSTQNTKLKHRLARGRILPEQLDELCNIIRLSRLKEKDSIHIVFLHHPLIGAEGNNWESTMELDERQVVANRLYELADVVLAGHIHQDFILSKKDNPSMPNHAIAGTGTQQFSNRSFMLLDIYERKIRLYVFEYDQKTLEFIPTQEKTFTLKPLPIVKTKINLSLSDEPLTEGCQRGIGNKKKASSFKPAL